MKPANLFGGFAVPLWPALAFTLVMSLLPKPPALLLPGGDKFQHTAAFAVFSLLAWLAFPRWRIVELFPAMAASAR
jgi:hypothetical protein